MKVSVKSIGHKRHRAGGLGVCRVDVDSPHSGQGPAEKGAVSDALQPHSESLAGLEREPAPKASA